MSNALAIAAVTATLSNLLQNVNQGTGLNGVTITAKPLDKARDGNSNQINLFLYQVLPNAAWRNMDIPQRVKSGETGIPPLALNLYYMLTAYGEGNDDVLGHRLLGHSMSILYDHPLLGAQEIQAALGNLDSGLQNQVERVRITFQPLTVEEIFRLWSGFQTQYRVSVSYEAAVVLIESTRPVKTPLPVVARGKDDRGIPAQGNLIPPFPTLLTANPPNQQSSIRLGEVLALNGFHLDIQNPQIRFTHVRLGITQTLSPETGGTASGLTVKIPDNDPNNWPSGLYTVTVLFTRDDGAAATTNDLPVSLAPQIAANPPIGATRTGNAVTITLTCLPAVWQGQHVALLVGDQEVPFAFPAQPAGSPPPAPIQNLTFDAGDIAAGEYFVRLRVDGVDSILVDQTVTPPKFDQSQKVIVP